MTVQIDDHTLLRAAERGTNREEITETITSGNEIETKYKRKAKYKIYNFENIWNGKFYKHKRVEVVFVIEHETIITVTVYVFYGQWEK